MTVPISAVALGADEEALVLEVLRSGRLAQGPMVERLEAAFCTLAGTKHAVATSSGTTALVLALEVLGLESGDEVVTSPFTFVATLNAIIEAGATATFADIGDDFMIDAEGVSAAVTDRTRALMPVHLFGLPADAVRLESIAAQHGLAMVEDAAQAIGASIDGRPTGSFGLGCFSLYATKNVTTGEGGVVTTDDDEIADRMRVLRNQGMRARYQYEVPGHNYRLTDLQAAVGLPQLARLDEITAVRRRNAALLGEGLADLHGLLLPQVPEGREHVWHQYTVRVTPEARLDRDALAEALRARGIGSGVYYPRPVFDYDCYRDHPQVRIAEVPAAHQVAREVLSLPVHAALSDGDVGKVVDAVVEMLA